MFFSSKPKAEQTGSPDALPAGSAGSATSGGAVTDSESAKKAIIHQILVESNTSNARLLMENMNQQCFDSCVPKPGSSISSSEQKCVSQCMEKYISAWNHVNAAYLQRLNQEVSNGGGV